MNNGVISIQQASQVLGNLALQDNYISGTDYNTAIQNAVSAGKIIQFPNGLTQSVEAVRTEAGFTLAGVISAIKASATQAGQFLLQPAMVVVKASLWVIGIAVASALGLTIGVGTYEAIEEAKPEAFDWLRNRLNEIGWTEFDFMVAENGLSYLPTAVVEIYRDWFDYLGLFNNSTIERQPTVLPNVTLTPTDYLTIQEAFSDIPTVEGLNQYQGVLMASELFASTYGYEIPNNAYIHMQGRLTDTLSGINLRMWICENVDKIISGSDGYNRLDSSYINAPNASVKFLAGIGIVTFMTVRWVNQRISVRIDNHLTGQDEHAFSPYGSTTTSLFAQDNLGKARVFFPTVSLQNNAVIPTIGASLSETYADWFNNEKTIETPEDEIKFLPVSIPYNNLSTTIPQTQTQAGENEDNAYANQLTAEGSAEAVGDLTLSGANPIPNPPMLPIGGSPIIPSDILDPVGMYTVYNPTISEVTQFSQFLWTTNFVDNIKKLFLDPFQGIITLYKLYATPTTSTDKQEINIAWLGSNVNAYRVTNQFIEIDCGTVRPWQYYGNVLDFNPYTDVKIYLPFIGIVPLNTNQIIRHDVNVKYKIDVTTATCVANVFADDVLLYSFNGNCGVQMPLTGSNYSAIVGGLMSVAGGVVATIASGGTLAVPALVGGVAGALNSKTQIQQSGSLGSNAGVLAPRIPYLIIERPKSYEALDYQNYYGIPSNERVQLSQLSGYTKIKNVHITNINALETEIDTIENLLMEGIII